VLGGQLHFPQLQVPPFKHVPEHPQVLYCHAGHIPSDGPVELPETHLPVEQHHPQAGSELHSEQELWMLQIGTEQSIPVKLSLQMQCELYDASYMQNPCPLQLFLQFGHFVTFGQMSEVPVQNCGTLHDSGSKVAFWHITPAMSNLHSELQQVVFSDGSHCSAFANIPSPQVP